MSFRELITRVSALLIFMTSVTAWSQPNGFAWIEKPARSVQDLVSDCRQSTELAKSYALAFGVPDSQVRALLRALHAQKLSAKVKCLVRLRTDGTPPETVTLPAGELVFVDAQGRPVIRASDGAPISLAGDEAQGGPLLAGEAPFAVALPAQQDPGPGGGNLDVGGSIVTGLIGVGMLEQGMQNNNKNLPVPNSTPEPSSWVMVFPGVGFLIAQRLRKNRK